MSHDLYSDPYLNALLRKEPKLAKEFLEAILNSEYVLEPEIVSCLETPGWVLERTGVKGFINPNFPSKVFDEFLEDEDSVAKNFWSVFEYPNLKQEHIDKLKLSSDENVRGLALSHPLGNSSELLSFLEKMLLEHNLAITVIYRICQQAILNDEIFSLLFNAPDFHGTARLIGESLWKNPTLSEEHKAALLLAGILPKDDSAQNYWNEDLHFISSIPYFDILKVDLGQYKSQKLHSMSKLKNSLEEFFTNEGHHLSVVLSRNVQTKINPSLRGLKELISLEIFHRLFWTDLCERDDFEIYRRNYYRVDDVFISHPILGLEFAEGDAEDSTKLGGVIVYGNQKWLDGEEELDVDRAAQVLISYEDSMLAILENDDYSRIGQFLIALTYNDLTLSEKYGFELTDDAYDWMVTAAIEVAESDDFEVSARINPNFPEILSWSKISDSQKNSIFEFLKIGFDYKDSKLRNDSIHFMGCMALHDSTPESLLAELKKLGDPLVNDVLNTRKKCTSCGKSIGYGFCLTCEVDAIRLELNFSEDEADEIYLKGLELARNGDKIQAMEAWLPLAKFGDVITIDALIITLWRLGRKNDAESWIVRLAKLDIEQLKSLAERLEVPFSQFESYISKYN